MKLALLSILLLLTSCSTFEGAPSQGKRSYSYIDVSGTYRLVREVKVINKKIITRNQFLVSTGGSNKVVEKSITVSQIGSVKKGKQRLLTVRPFASEFNVWLEGKRYESKMKLIPSKKSLQLNLNSPESKWQGISEVPVPKGRFFCFYSQIPECLHHNQLLAQARERPTESFNFLIVWDNFPYLQEQLAGVGGKVFAVANLKFDGEVKKRIRYIIELEGQVLLYQFSNSYDLEKMTWVAQGITMVPPGEEESDIENQ